jgi:hypothetical protein
MYVTFIYSIRVGLLSLELSSSSNLVSISSFSFYNYFRVSRITIRVSSITYLAKGRVSVYCSSMSSSVLTNT